jgi:circadian clock protein KaiB
MSKKEIEHIKFKKEPAAAKEDIYILRLFVTGILPNSTRAISNINAICEQYLKGRHELVIIDIFQQPDLALTEDLIAVPLLIKKFPLPEQRIIGDLSDTLKVLEGLDII